MCEKTDSLLIKPENVNTGCSDFFNNLINQTCKPTFTKNLYYRQSESLTNSYIAAFSLTPASNQTEEVAKSQVSSLKSQVYCFIEIDSKFIPKDLGYPKLLIDRNLNVNNDYSNYAYSKYKNSELIYQFGKYFYNSTLDRSKKTNKEFSFVNSKMYSHLVYNADKNTTYIISREKETFINRISPFSYLIIFFSLFFVLLILIINNPLNLKINEISLQSRIQYSIIFIVLISFLFIGSVTVYYINQSNENRNLENLREKTHSMLVEVENTLSDEESSQTPMNDNISGTLLHISNVFFADINLYNEQGRLLSTSRPKIFEQGLISKNMNSVAFEKMFYENRTIFTQKENIGRLEFYSSYMPVRNMQGKVIAYLNLPYFSQQSENINEISVFLTTFINIYLILVALSIFIVFLISHYITSPLKMIQDKISRIKLGTMNEKLEWTREDELGNLIKEYNKMVDEIERSAELLAKSERESAWREMAKQVAHEIKNPLTPMKLNIQHLNKLLEDTKTPHKDRIDRITKTLIEQIDILSGIATEFSDFAKMPVIKKDKIELRNVIANSAELYLNSEKVKIEIKSDKKEYYVISDYKQLLRAFNNLIKNAVQAVETRDDGEIIIQISEEENNYPVKITDNGIGIAEEDKSKIFAPNFTTKSGGTGLGLSLVRNIIESAGGKIWFESKVDKGTVFYILIPAFNEA